MIAKQTLSASLVVLLFAASPVLADPEPDDANAEPQPASEDPPKTGTFEIGAGYQTDEGFLARATIEQSNLFHTGKGLSMSAMISRRRQEFITAYDDPALLGSQLRLRGELYAKTKLFPGFKRESAGGALTLTERIAPNLDFFVGYRLEHVTVTPGDTSLFRGGVAQEPSWRGGLLSAMRAGISYADVDRADYPMRGTTVGTAVEVADRELGSDAEYVRLDSWFGHHRALGPFTLHAGGHISTITDSAPMSERLHFDGSSQIRGYAPGEVGPHDLAGLPTGGNLMWSARTELEAPLIPSAGISAVGFVDVGGLYAKWGGQTAASAGFGLIWRSPIGALRFDWAYPLDGSKPRFLFGIGF